MIAQWLVVGLGLLLVPRRSRVIAVFGVGAVLFGMDTVNRLPSHPLVSPARIEASTLDGLPPVGEGKSLQDQTLAARGRYLFTITSCVMCHNAAGDGGAKISWKPFGTLYARNLTNDAEYGLATWTDAQIARAIRSGISRDGRALHWQGMPWDLFSNLEEEDLRALAYYLRSLPPVPFEVNEPVPPASDDCDAYTLFLLR